MENRVNLPDDLLSVLRKRSNRVESSRFPYKIWLILDYTDNDEKFQQTGCKWINDTNFFLDKEKLCHILDCKRNSLNINLKALGFVQVSNKNGKTIFKNLSMNKDYSKSKFEKIKNSKSKLKHLESFNHKAIYFPLLESLKLFLDDMLTYSFKRDVIECWEVLTDTCYVFVFPINRFKKVLIKNLGDNDDIYNGSMLIAALDLSNQNYITFFEFAVFLARFGPFKQIYPKLIQLKHIVIDEFSSVLYFFHNCYSKTYHNCFSFNIGDKGEYHCYNRPDLPTETGFIYDEDGVTYYSWNDVFQKNKFLYQQ